jgi:hypothetical protein
VIFVWKYVASPFYFPSQNEIVNIIFFIGFSFRPQQRASGHAYVHTQTCPLTHHVVSKRRTGWSSKLLDIFDQVILLWVYKVVDMKYNRRGGTKVWVRLRWSSVATGAVSQLLVSTVTLNNNGLGEVIRACCYYDRARLATTERSNGRSDRNGLLLIWTSSTHRKIYDINNKVS